MRGRKRPNLWVIGTLAFCVAVWGLGLLAVAKTAHIYTHKSPAGFRHDLMARTKHHLHELKGLVGEEPKPVMPETAAPSEQI